MPQANERRLSRRRAAPKHAEFACSLCGWKLRLREPASSVVLPVHAIPDSLPLAYCPGSASMPWTKALGWAYSYVCMVASQGERMDEWAKTTPMHLWTGTTRPDLIVALQMARRWRRKEYREGFLPPAPSPRGLFG